MKEGVKESADRVLGGARQRTRAGVVAMATDREAISTKARRECARLLTGNRR